MPAFGEALFVNSRFAELVAVGRVDEIPARVDIAVDDAAHLVGNGSCDDETARSLYDWCCRWSVDGRLGSGFRKRPRAQLLRIPLALSNQLDNPARENVFHETRPWLSLKSAACLIERCRHCRDHFGTERRAA
jgi:hypothetical protein